MNQGLQNSELVEMQALFKETFDRVSKYFTQELDRVFREALTRECGEMPDETTLRTKGQIVIDRDNTHRLLWKRDDGKYHEIAAVTCQFGKVSMPPTF